MNIKTHKMITGTLLIVASLSFLCAAAFTQDPKTNITPASAADTTGDSATKEDASSQSADISKLDEAAAKTEEALKAKKEHADQTKEEAEKILQEKQRIEKEAALKEKAAEVTKQELAVVKKEAKITKDPELKKRAKELAEQAEQLDKEAAIQREKLEVAEAKARLADDKLAASQATIESLKKELDDLRYARAAKRGPLYNVLVSIAIIIAGTLVVFAFKVLTRFMEIAIAKKYWLQGREIALRIKTLGKIFYWAATIVIGITVLYLVLATFGVSVAPLIAGAGIVGLAFGFGGQYLIRDIINGFFIVIEGQYRIEDVVKIGDFGGLVEDVNLRITTLRDLEGRVIIIPNGEIKTVVNYTKEYAQALLDVSVAYKENVDKVMEVIKGLGREMRGDPAYAGMILDDLEMLGVDDFTESAVIVRFRIKTLPMRQWDVSREFRRRLKKRFDELGIEMPFPHRRIYWGSGNSLAKKSISPMP